MAQPITWANKVTRSISSTGARGRRVIEKIPQSASLGDYDDPRPAPAAWRKVVDTEGNELRVLITCSSADVDIEGPMGRDRRAKWRHFGWYEIGRCPIALVQVGELSRDHFAAPEMLDQRACEPHSHSVRNPCPHALAERDARRIRNAEDQAEIARNYRRESDRIIEGHAQNNQQLVKDLAGIMQETVAATAAAVTPPAKDKK